jgi:hypothetical protein
MVILLALLSQFDSQSSVHTAQCAAAGRSTAKECSVVCHKVACLPSLFVCSTLFVGWFNKCPNNQSPISGNHQSLCCQIVGCLVGGSGLMTSLYNYWQSTAARGPGPTDNLCRTRWNLGTGFIIPLCNRILHTTLSTTVTRDYRYCALFCWEIDYETYKNCHFGLVSHHTVRKRMKHSCHTWNWHNLNTLYPYMSPGKD